MRILSGIQVTGKLHIGNYLGMIRQMVAQQDTAELYCFIANLHSLTSVFDGKTLADNTADAILDLLALGIDPERALFYVQSDVPEVTELTWYLSTITPMGLLQRCHSYKDKIARDIPASHGLFSYPVLMAADILLYQADLVPVGQDQKQHLEVTRDIAIKFNMQYGETFKVPEAQIREEVAVIPGIDGQKMSKSYGNTLDMFAPEKQLRKKVMSIVTDSTPVEEPKEPDTNTIYQLFRLFASESEVAEMAGKFRAGGYGYGDAKKTLFERLMDYFGPARKRREELAKDAGIVEEIRRRGAERARAEAMKTLEEVRGKLGVR